jgi:hypothetical protein
MAKNIARLKESLLKNMILLHGIENNKCPH